MMSMMFAGTGIPEKVGTPLPGIRPQPAAASPQAEGTQDARLLLPIAMPSLTDGDVSEPPVQDRVDVTSAESDPQQLLALLLATPITISPIDSVPRVSTQAAVPSMSADLLCGTAETDHAGLLRNSVLAAGHHPTGRPVQREELLSSDAVAARYPESGAMLPMLQPVPKKRLAPAEALLTSPVVQQVLQVEGESLTTDKTPQHPAPALLNTLLKGDAEAKTLPTIVLPAAAEQKAGVLQKALAERLEMQIDRHVQKATIRLDPPNLGKLDISIHFESGKLQVQIQAAQPDVTRLLQQVSNDMRASLSEQHSVQVNVQVSTQNGDSRQQHRHRDNPETGIDKNNEEVATRQGGTDGTILSMA